LYSVEVTAFTGVTKTKLVKLKASSANNLATLFLINFPPVSAEFGGTELQNGNKKTLTILSGDESYQKNRNPAPRSTTVRNI
jgi:hypothetical protein